MSQEWDALLPLLVHIQANLDGDLSLSALSAKVDLSPAHFHKLFKAVIGETPKVHVTRLRLDRAAFRLLIHDSTLIEIALDCGFANHETFTRAFRRQFGKSPSGYRSWIARQVSENPDSGRSASTGTSTSFAISATKVIRLQPAHLAFIRHVGPYESVPDTLFDELDDWARRRNLTGPRIWMGIGHDAPVATPANRLRFDAALVVPAEFAAAGRVGFQRFDGGEFAVTTHAGPFDTLPAAYAKIFPRMRTLRGFKFVGLPAVEIYHAARINSRLRLNQTDICLPVLQKR